MRHFIFSWRNNEAPHFFSEEIMRHFIFFWRINEMPHLFLKRYWGTWFFTAAITLAGLLRYKAQSPHYFFRKKWSASWCLQKKWRATLCLQKIISTFSEEIMRHFMFLLGTWFFYCRDNVRRLIEVTNPSALLFLQTKKWSTSLFLQKKMRRLIISSTKKSAFFCLEK